MPTHQKNSNVSIKMMTKLLNWPIGSYKGFEIKWLKLWESFKIEPICGWSAEAFIFFYKIALAWNSGRLKNDISLLKLKTPIDFSPGVQPIHLPAAEFRSDKDSPQRTDIQSQVNGPVCLISGYGTIKFKGSPPDMLQQATVPLITRNGLQLSLV